MGGINIKGVKMKKNTLPIFYVKFSKKCVTAILKWLIFYSYMPDISAVCGVELLIWLLFPELLTAVAGLLITETVTPLSEYLKK